MPRSHSGQQQQDGGRGGDDTAHPLVAGDAPGTEAPPESPGPLEVLDDFAIVGTSWRRGGIETLTRFTLPEDVRAERLLELAAALRTDDLVYVATCNRVELAFRHRSTVPLGTALGLVYRALTGLEPRPGELDRSLQMWRGEEALSHLFEVAAGLDSAQVGEREIRGQLRAAANAARELGMCGPVIEEIFSEALRTARRVHQETGIGAGRTSLAEIGLDYLRQHLRRCPGRVALIGVSAMTAACARALAGEQVPIVVVNRSLAKAQRLADELEAQARSLADFRQRPDEVVAVLSATGSTQPILDHDDLERLLARRRHAEPLLLVDMAVPPDVDAGTARALGAVRVGMAEITAEAEAHREQRLVEAKVARDRVRRGVVKLRRVLAERTLAPVLAELGRRYQRTALEGLESLLRRELADLEEPQREALRRWAVTLSRRLAHVPTVGLRSLAAENGVEAVRAFLHSHPGLLEVLPRPRPEPD